MSAPDALTDAEATEDALRAQLAELVSAKVRAEKESARLADRAGITGADPSLAGLAERYAAQGARLASEVEEVRAGLRTQEAATEALRARDAGA